jgi:7-cyano-7-deazaguanine synthase in queuosine biosynthesis/predicted glutamine amidotransferase
MCGIAGMFMRESVPDLHVFDKLFMWSEKRGTDGFGATVIKRHPRFDKPIYTFKSVEPYSACYEQVHDFLDSCNLEVGDLVLAISRAAPETESRSTEGNMQPITHEDEKLVLVHNGAISNAVYWDIRNEAENEEYYGDDAYSTQIDSEAIVFSYLLAEKNIKKAMERISGGVAALMYDGNKDCLYIINDFKPIAHGYIRGVGYILASDNDCIGEIIQSYTGCERDGICLWENWYHHYLGGGRVKQVDLDSGFVQNIKYSPRFMTQSWDSNNPKPILTDVNFSPSTDQHVRATVIEPGNLCLVSCSGGMDSSLTLAILAMSGFKNIVACHFKYGHRGQDAEHLAVKNVVAELNAWGFDVKLKVFDIETLVTSIDSDSMLIDPEAKITTGTAEGLKKLDAWVCGRNMFFLNTMAAYAEAQTMKHEYEKVFLLGGFLNLTESGHYPDNSEYFVSSALEYFKYATLIGHRIKPLYCLSNLMKSDQFALIKAFGMQQMYKHTISCDRPTVEWRKDGSIPRNCSYNGIPACGSGLLSYWASQMVGLNDMEIRNFYEVDEPYEAHKPAHLGEGELVKVIPDIIDRIMIPEENKQTLLQKFKEVYR